MKKRAISLVFLVLVIGVLACGSGAEQAVTPSALEQVKDSESDVTVEEGDEAAAEQEVEEVSLTEIPATATPAIPPLEILSHQSYTDGGWFHVVGEVQNNSETAMDFVKIVITLYDESGGVVGTDFTYTELDVIPPGGKAPFSSGTDEFGDVASYEVQVQGSECDTPDQVLEVVSHDSYVDGGWLHVRGEVKNSGEADQEFVKIVVTLYDASGAVVGADFSYTDLDVIPAGGTAPFETGTDHFPNFDHYEVQVQGSDV